MLTGIVFGIIAIVWIAYLVPWFLSQRASTPSRPGMDLDELHDSIRVVTRPDDPAETFLTDSGANISTPPMRNAARYHLRRDQQAAVRRRRLGILAHLLLLVAGIVIPFIFPISHFWSLVPVAMFAGWLLLCRVSVVTVDRMTHRRIADLEGADEEETILIEAPADDGDAGTERSVSVTGPLTQTLGSLWDPIPVVPTTYVSRPLPPRSVRTVDLSAPVSSAEAETPLLGDIPVEHSILDEDPSESEGFPRAVGE